MKFSYKSNGDFFTFYKNDSLIKVSENNLLIAINSDHAELILKDLRKKEVKPDQFSILGLSMFASSLDNKLIDEIVLKLLKSLDFDLLLYRYFDDETLVKRMNQKYAPFINTFNKLFNIKLKVIEGFVENTNYLLDKKLFKKFIMKLDNFYLTALFKLSGISKSVILSYFFLENKVDIPEFFKLINLENKFQQNQWGYIDEQKKNDQYYLSSLKKISFFLKNVN
jgi:chaperone required for assembly of F1-ATPase